MAESLATELASYGIAVISGLYDTNRLVAGLSLGSVIIEATSRSGTLIRARLAESYNRLVCAVPGSPFDPRSRSGNQLLPEGAVLVEQAAGYSCASDNPYARLPASTMAASQARS